MSMDVLSIPFYVKQMNSESIAFYNHF